METKATQTGADRAPEKGWPWTVQPEHRYAVEERTWRLVWTLGGACALWGLWQAVGYLRQIALKE